MGWVLSIMLFVGWVCFAAWAVCQTKGWSLDFWIVLILSWVLSWPMGMGIRALQQRFTNGEG